ncbi:MAG: rRNA maturation RNase YbeY [Firmicutes bacterium]|nr:rRNA maturation RNase YbeY [Bacillota bacterium]
MYIYLEEGQVLEETLLKKMEEAADVLFEKEGVDGERAEISLTLVSLEEIRELNRDYRDVDKETDVLSFPQFEGVEDMPEFGELCLGDVVICRDKVEEQAKEFGHSFERELIYLFVHSMLHLLGYDHMEEDEKAVMRAKEEEVMKVINLER